MKVIAVISQPEAVEKFLAHVKLPVSPDMVADGCLPAFDVTGETIPDWVTGTNPEDGTGLEDQPHGYERGPPGAFDGVDPPCPHECLVLGA